VAIGSISALWKRLSTEQPGLRVNAARVGTSEPSPDAFS